MNTHHLVDANPCPLCFKKLQDANPKIAAWFKRLKVMFPNAHISQSYRTKEDQDKAFSEGKSKLKFPNSPHNAVDAFGKPSSKALDIFCLSEDGVAKWPPLFYAKINEWNVNNQEPIKWGGTFKTLGDANHFELQT